MHSLLVVVLRLLYSSQPFPTKVRCEGVNLNHINHRLSSGSVRPSIEKALDFGDRFDSGDSFLFSESQVVIRG